MTRIDRLIVARLSSRIGVTVFVFFGIIALAESLDVWRFNYVAEQRGMLVAVIMVAMSAVRWSIKTLPVTVLLGAILGFLDLKSRRELTVISATGVSIWRIVRAPIMVLILVSLVIALVGETLSTQVNREINPTPATEVALLTPPGEVWLEQRSGSERYVMLALDMEENGRILHDVTVFPLGTEGEARIEAEDAYLENGAWVFPSAVLRNADRPEQNVTDYRLPTTSSPAELALKLTSADDMTFFEVAELLSGGVSDPVIRTAATMRVIKLLALPLVLTGSLFIAFAFTAGYSRTTRYGPAVLYGVVLGFIVFIITEMADRAGSTGVLNPAFAALAPAFVAIVVGVSVLLRKEDGRI